MNDLLICAKAVGHQTAHTQSEVWIYTANNLRIPYTPLTNDAQNRELELYLLDKGWLIWKTADKYTFDDNDGLEIRGDTLNEAIIRAVVAMEDTHE